MINQADGELNNHFYSFNIGPAHIISLSTEFYFFIEYGWTQIARQYEWLENDLKEATKPENRAKHPWIITIGHRPMYCSTDDADDCSFKESIVSLVHEEKKFLKNSFCESDPKRNSDHSCVRFGGLVLQVWRGPRVLGSRAPVRADVAIV